MAVPYSKLVTGIALRLNALVGNDPTSLETTYIKTTLTQSDFDSGDWTYTFAKDLAILAEGRYAGIIAGVGNQPLRRALHSVTASIAKGGVIAATDSAGEKILGIFGSVRDASDFTVMTEQPLEVIRRYNAETWRTYPIYAFKIDGTRLEHTRTGATIDVCVYNAATQRTSLQAGGNMILPDHLESGLICEGVSMAFRDDMFPSQAQQYRNYSNGQIGLIQQGLTSIPSKSVPGPTLSQAAT